MAAYAKLVEEPEPDEPQTSAWTRGGLDTLGAIASMTAKAAAQRRQRREKGFASADERSSMDEEGARPLKLTSHGGTVNELCFSPDAMIVASGAEDNKLNVHNVHSHALLRTEEFASPVTAIAFSPSTTESLQLALGCEDGTGRIAPLLPSDSSAGEAPVQPFFENSHISSLSFAPDGESFASVELGRKVVVRETSASTSDVTYAYPFAKGEAQQTAAVAAFSDADSLLLAAQVRGCALSALSPW